MPEPDPQPAPSWKRAFRWIVGGAAGLFGLLVLLLIASSQRERPAGRVNPRGDVQFLHAMNLPVRNAEELRVTDETRRVSVEVYRDKKTGNAVYISRPDVTRKGISISAAAGSSR